VDDSGWLPGAGGSVSGMRPATVPAALRDRPFTTADARRHGLPPRMLAGPTWRRVTRGVYVHAAVPDSGHLRAAASGLALGPDAFVCGPTAAWVDGVAVGDADRPDAPV
jgi:hypothetical protein